VNGRILTAAALAVAVAAPQATAAQIEVRRTNQTIPAAGIERFTIGCPPGAVALAGGVRNLPPSAGRVSGSIPQTATSWSFAVDARTSAVGVTTTVFLTCLDVPSPPRGYAVELGPVQVRLPASLERGQTADLTLGCPSGHVPTGYGIESTGGQQPTISSVGKVGDVSVIMARPAGHAVQLSLANSGEAVDLTAGAQCTPRQATARLRPRTRQGKRPRTLAWKYRSVLQSSPESLSAGDNNNRRRRCNRHRRRRRSVGSKAVSTWHELPASTSPSVFTSYPGGRDGVWNIYSGAAGQATLHLLCQSAATRWR